MTNLTYNNANCSSMPDLSNEVQVLIGINLVLKTYVIRIVSGLGVFLNIFSMIICANKKLTHHIYSYLWCRGLINGLVCLLGASFLQLPLPPTPQSYALVFVSLYIINIPMRVAFLASAFEELALILNRLFVIQKKHNYFSQMSKVQNIIFCFFLPVLDSIPGWIALEIQDFPGSDGMYQWGLTEFGKSTFFQAYYIANFFLETVVPVFVLLPLNIYTVRKLKEHLNRTKAIKKTKSIKKNTKFTWLMTVLVSLSVFARSIDMITGIMIRLKVVLKDILDLTEETRKDFLFFNRFSYPYH